MKEKTELFDPKEILKKYVKRQTRYKGKNRTAQKIENNLTGLYNYLTAPNIRNKQTNVLFFALRFSKSFQLLVHNECLVELKQSINQRNDQFSEMQEGKKNDDLKTKMNLLKIILRIIKKEIKNEVNHLNIPLIYCKVESGPEINQFQKASKIISILEKTNTRFIGFMLSLNLPPENYTLFEFNQEAIEAYETFYNIAQKEISSEEENVENVENERRERTKEFKPKPFTKTFKVNKETLEKDYNLSMHEMKSLENDEIGNSKIAIKQLIKNKKERRKNNMNRKIIKEFPLKMKKKKIKRPSTLQQELQMNNEGELPQNWFQNIPNSGQLYSRNFPYPAMNNNYNNPMMPMVSPEIAQSYGMSKPPSLSGNNQMPYEQKNNDGMLETMMKFGYMQYLMNPFQIPYMVPMMNMSTNINHLDNSQNSNDIYNNTPIPTNMSEKFDNMDRKMKDQSINKKKFKNKIDENIYSHPIN